jgi:thioredoxin 1
MNKKILIYIAILSLNVFLKKTHTWNQNKNKNEEDKEISGLINGIEATSILINSKKQNIELYQLPSNIEKNSDENNKIQSSPEEKISLVNLFETNSNKIFLEELQTTKNNNIIKINTKDGIKKYIIVTITLSNKAIQQFLMDIDSTIEYTDKTTGLKSSINIKNVESLIISNCIINKKKDTPCNDEEKKNNITVNNITKKNLPEILSNNDIICIKFYADWCNPCKKFSPIFEKISSYYKNNEIYFGSINITEEEELAKKYNIDIIPSILIIKNKKVIHKIVGSTNEETIIEILNNIIKK